MPKNLFEEVVFTAVMSLFMVYGMICYNMSVAMGGCTDQVFLMAFSELKIMWPVAFILEMFVVGKIAPIMAFKVVDPRKDRPQFITYAISFCICALMCPLMSLVATILFNEPSVGTYAQTWAMNLPAAYLWQFVVVGPVTRFLFRAAFRRSEAKVENAEGIAA
ncbi:MAG: DUF2798 domain-containing protein [Clostridia bacterium]|nr:DUF2798 domain-containing protein [Clostridia bacterium]